MLKFWNALVRVVKIEDESIWVVVPEWNAEQFVLLPSDLLNEDQKAEIKIGYRFFAQVTTDALTASELKFKDAEITLPETKG